MQSEEITIRVDPEAARVYRAASDQDRNKFDLLLSLRLHDALRLGGSLTELMRGISRKAQGHGLTPEILDSILHEPRCIVSGDGDLLALSPFRGVPVARPAQFLKMVSPQGQGGA